MKTHTLRSLSAEKVVKKTDAFRARLADIHILDGFNVRTEDEELREHIAGIVGAIIAGLPIPPLEVWVNPESGVMELVDGHCRYKAYQQFAAHDSEFDGYVSVVKFDGSPVERKARIISSNSQLKLKPWEVAAVVVSMRDEYGMSRVEIAKALGKSPAHVDQMFILGGAPEPVKKGVEEGKISATEAVKLVRAHGENSAAELERREELAKEQGKERITPKVSPKKQASRPRIDFVVSCAAVLTTHIERDTELMDQLKSAGKDDRVSVSADLLLDLIESVREMRESGKALDADQQQEMAL